MPDTGLSGRSVLVVDDEDVFLRSVVEGLATELPGVELFTAHDGREALGVLEQHLVDLVVTDVNMPEMDGMVLVAEMISRGFHLPVIMVTAFGNRSLEVDARRNGVLSVVDKPIDYPQLVELCRSTLRSLGRGSLGGVTLAGLLQLLEMERRSCTVRAFCGDHSGRVLIDHGRIIGSIQGEDAGMSALTRILSWPEPAIEIGPLRRSERGGSPISLQAALLDAARLEDERGRPRASAVPEFVPDDFSFEESGSGLLVLPTDEGEPTIREEHATHRETNTERQRSMANIEQSINAAMGIQGCIAAALVDYESGMCLGSKANGFPIEVAAAGNTEVIRSKFRVMEELGLEGGITDILITLDTQYHLLLPLRQGSLFLYLAIDRKAGNLAMARHKLMAVEKALVI
ncbi:MAG: response regulator [Myxococcales bacterium]|nr:response regulator [Myxococcales bacterium]